MTNLHQKIAELTESGSPNIREPIFFSYLNDKKLKM